MITHRAIAARFKAGESVEDIAVYTSAWDKKRACSLRISYVEHAIRQVMKQQGRAR